jgi:tetratricopeptide (TPR) repeat protein
MDSLPYWMPALRKFHKDYSWISSRVDHLYAAITSAVNRPPEHRMAIEALKLLYQYILIYGDWERWVRLWYDALRNAQVVNDSPTQTHLWREMGGLYTLSGQHKRSRAALMNFLERAEEGNDVELIFSGYIGLIHLQTISQDSTFNDKLVASASSVAQQLNEPRKWAELHQALAAAYNSRHETVHALAHGQTAYAYWYTAKATLEMARVAFTLSQTCRLAKLFQQSKRFLDISRAHYAKTPSGERMAALDYEEGQLCLDQGNYEEAANWFEYVHQEFSRLNQPQYQAAVVHSLALAYDFLGRYEDSRSHFEKALMIWRQLENVYEQAHLYDGWAEMESHRGDSVQCLECLYEGFRLCEQLPDTPARRKIEDRMNDILDEISKPPLE